MFSTIELAMRAALIASYLCGGQQYECGGVIYQRDDGTFTYTSPITDHKPFGVTVPYLYSVPPVAGERVVADYHNHICDKRNRMFAAYFSPADGMVNVGFHISGYMLDGCTGNMHVFDPREQPHEVMVAHFTSGKELELPIGHIVGWADLKKLRR